jgi:hypothetical protein
VAAVAQGASEQMHQSGVVIPSRWRPVIAILS